MPGVVTIARRPRPTSRPLSARCESTANVSGNSVTEAPTTTATSAHIQNTACHGPINRTAVASDGAKAGTRMNTAMISDICLAICSPS